MKFGFENGYIVDLIKTNDLYRMSFRDVKGKLCLSIVMKPSEVTEFAGEWIYFFYQNVE